MDFPLNQNIFPDEYRTVPHWMSRTPPQGVPEAGTQGCYIEFGLKLTNGLTIIDS